MAITILIFNMKILKALSKAGKITSVITPDIHVYNYIKTQKINYLDIFYSFGQFLLERNVKKSEFKIVMQDLNNRIVQLKYFVKKINNKEKRLLKRKEEKKNIYNYKPYQVLLGLIEAYWNKLHSIADLVKKIDGLYSTNFYEKLNNEKWFTLQMGLRHLCHHIESPLITKEKGRVMLMFEKAKEVRKSEKYFKDWMFNSHGRIHVYYSSKNIDADIIRFINEMAKSILSKLAPLKSIKIIAGHNKDKSLKEKEIKLQELYEKIENNQRKNKSR